MSTSDVPAHRARARRIDALTRELAAEIDAGLGDGAIAALDPATARTLVAAAARAYASAAEEGAEPPSGTDLAPTDAVVLATAVLRAHDLNPFDLALWFSRGASTGSASTGSASTGSASTGSASTGSA